MLNIHEKNEWVDYSILPLSWDIIMPVFLDLHLSRVKFLLLMYETPLVTNSARCINVL